MAWQPRVWPPLLYHDGARDSYNIDKKIGRVEGRSSKSSDKFWKMIDQHEYQKALLVLIIQKLIKD